VVFTFFLLFYRAICAKIIFINGVIFVNVLEIDRALAFGRTQGHNAANLFIDARNSGLFKQYAQGNNKSIERLKKATKGLLAQDIIALRFSKHRLFAENGSRKEYEKDYFENHRTRLTCAAISELIEGKGEYISEIEDMLWAICDEYTWCLPAHLFDKDYIDRSVEIIPSVSITDSEGFAYSPVLRQHKHIVDLFSSETAFLLAELISLLQEKLHPLVKDRAKKLIFERVLQPYMDINSHFFWDTVTSNWAAVCAGSVGCTALYLIEDEHMLSPILHRCISAMEAFLEGYPNDGVCSEGPVYWGYGYGFFTYFSALLKERTADKINLFSLEKAKAAALAYPQMFLMEGCVVNFADSVKDAKLAPELMCYLKGIYEEFEVPIEYFNMDNHIAWGSKFPADLRKIVWNNAALKPTERKQNKIYFPDTQWFISRFKKGEITLAFAAKAGSNNEQHNHNDVGGFILLAQGEELVQDIGRGEYTRQNFGAERYSIFPNSSLGHSVPIIDEKPQIAGAGTAARVILAQQETDKDIFEFEFSKAYACRELTSLIRRFEIDKGNIKITDTLKAEKKVAFQERFITDILPVIKGDRVLLQSKKATLELSFDASTLLPAIEEHIYAGIDGKDTKVYSINLIAKEKSESLSVSMELNVV